MMHIFVISNYFESTTEKTAMIIKYISKNNIFKDAISR